MNLMCDQVKQATMEEHGANVSNAIPQIQPNTNIYHDKNHIYLEVSLPGCLESSIDISIIEGDLRVSANYEEYNLSNYNILYSEYHNRNYYRSFKLDDRIDTDNIIANYNNGILIVKASWKQPNIKKVEVQKIEVQKK